MKGIDLVIATENPAKRKQIEDALSCLEIKLLALKDFNIGKIKVEEDGTTAQENARTKALAYSKALQNPVIAIDNALYLEGLDNDKQPGINVRRIEGRQDRPTDEELLTYYSKLISNLGGNINGYWLFAVCIALPDGRTFETEIKSPRRFVSKPSQTFLSGYPIDALQIDPESGRYISEIISEGKEPFWQKTIGKELSDFAKEAISKF